MTTKRTLRRHLAEANQQIRRLADAREDAVGTAGTEHFNVVRLARQLDQAREENEELRRRLKAAPAAAVPDAWKAERSELLRRLRQREEACASLDAQVRQLGRINEQQAAEAYNREEAAR
ncbi:hypothetical protein ACWERV_17220 [Streptomyces sp. NPDC004031]